MKPWKPLNERKTRTLWTPGRHADGGGLYLHIRADDSRSWLLRAVCRGKRTDFGLGAYPEVGLAEARETARAWRQLIREGRDPRAAGIASTLTFEAAAREVHAAQAPGWAPGHAARWIGSLERDVSPGLGSRPMAAIKPTDVVEILAPIWVEKHDTARRLRQRIMGIFEWAHAAGRLEGPNPMTGLPRLLFKVKREVAHFRGLPWRDVPRFYAELRGREAMAAHVMVFLLLTGTRSQEARGARWSEFGWSEDEGHVWTIPAARMKTKQAHRVPLASAAIEILDPLRGLHETFAFPSPVRRRVVGAITGEALSVLRRRMGVQEATTAHGLRGSFKSWSADTGQDRTMAELCLSHGHGNRVEQAYMRTEVMDRRRLLMEAWARHVTGAAPALGMAAE